MRPALELERSRELAEEWRPIAVGAAPFVTARELRDDPRGSRFRMVHFARAVGVMEGLVR